MLSSQANSDRHVRYVRYVTYYHISLVFIEFKARISGLSLETKIYLIRKEGKEKVIYGVWRPKNAFTIVFRNILISTNNPREL